MKYEARTKDGRKIGEFGSKGSAERHAKQYGGYTTHERGRKNYRELTSDIQWKRGY